MRTTRETDAARSLPFAAPVAAGLAAVLVLGAASLFGCGAGSTADESEATPMTGQDPVIHGEYLVSVGGCDDCHTPLKMGAEGPAPDMTRRLSGHPQEMVMPPAPDLGPGPWGFVGSLTATAYAGPWGTTYAANLTPAENGIKNWTEEMWLQTFRTGKHWGTGRQILPPMPIMAYANYPDEDLLAIRAYLMSLPPIDNTVPPYEPPAGGMAGSH